ncbi:hypothetical protein CSA56_12210 [candidate division KSB3 bacterium]|uniref:Bacterial sugar transferase domain-containing protein n=1 Tax=candidate division KSB3 bacterium TaxID=2044937 RepID=A0A2G6KCE1_9BACT|nr:MAG: hypothetical protein CSA56_12210 [candidate division KSB3 bacterium]
MKLLIALVNYNTTELLVKCLDSLESQHLDVDYRIVVVDNNSPDGGADQIREAYPEVTVLCNSQNGGYAKAVNQAIREFNSDYILLLNPDIEVKPGSLERMLAFMNTTPDAGIIGGKLLNPDGTLQYSCRTFYTLPIILYRRTFLGKLFPNSKILTRHLMQDWDHQSVREVDWMLGACLMIRRNALREVGLMDERFFLYFEDVDWCYRMKKWGWKVYYVPQAEMVHHHQRQSAQGFINKTLTYHITSMFHFYAKWGMFIGCLKKYRIVLGMLLFIVLDLAAINASFYAAHYIRDHLLSFLKKPHIPFLYYHKFLLFVNVVTPLVFSSLGLYRLKQGELWVDEIFRVGKGVIVNALLLMAGSYLVQGYEFSRVMISLFAVLAMFSCFALRWGAVSCYHFLLKKGFNLHRTLIIGTGKSATVVHKVLQKHRETAFDVVGFISDPHENIASETEQAFPILADITQLPLVIREHDINELIITTDSDSREIVSRSKQLGVNVRLITDFESLSVHETRFEELAGLPMVFFKGTPLFGMNLLIKRLMDVLFSAVGLVLLSPLLALIAFFIKLETPGPVIFHQKRVGKNAEPFTMLKFRSMCHHAEDMKKELSDQNEAHGPLFKMKNDPRHTKVGRIIRKLSLDELPQLWNVLRGDMSLVGPRPPVPEEVAAYDKKACKRLEIKPGITGLWQVSGRSDLTFDEMLKLDVYYMWNWSLSNDIKILLRTIPTVISGDGAY